MAPRLAKAAEVRGANVSLRDATVDDAAFILSLRLDPKRNQHLSPTSARLADQMAWLQAYAHKTDQAYFTVRDRAGNRLGCLRLYDPRGDSYCWGSWLMVGGLPPLVAVEAVVLAYAHARRLGFREARIDVRRDNRHVCAFHEKFFGAERVAETEQDIFYVVREAAIDASLRRFAHLAGPALA